MSARITESTMSEQQWDSALTQITNARQAFLSRNAALERRLFSLDTDYRTLETRFTQAVGELQQLRSPSRPPSSPLAVLAIDGSAFMFETQFIARGREGVDEAVIHLKRIVANHLRKFSLACDNVLLSVTIYMNRTDVAAILVSKGVCTLENFNAFLAAFSLLSGKFLVVDVVDEYDVRLKMTDHCLTMLNHPSTVHLIFASRDPHVFDTLAFVDAAGKVSSMDFSPTRFVREMHLPSLEAYPLFMDTRSLLPARTSPAPSSRSAETSIGLPSPLSPPSSISSFDPASDPSQPLSKRKVFLKCLYRDDEDPRIEGHPPCNEYYLMKCSKGLTCKYSHEYKLTKEQLAHLRLQAKKAPCNFVKNNDPCPYGDQCCWGHRCPNGKDCSYRAKGKCWFKGENMHC